MTKLDHNSQDREDLARYASGDERGMVALVRRYSSPLLNHCIYLLNGDQGAAEDVVQESFVKLWQNADKLLITETTFVRAWLFRVARNASIDRIRRVGGNADELNEDIKDTLPSVTAHLERADKARLVMDWISTLPTRQRSALLLSHFEAMGNVEIAQTLDTTVEAVENLLARGRRSLRAIAQAHKEEV